MTPLLICSVTAWLLAGPAAAAHLDTESNRPGMAAGGAGYGDETESTEEAAQLTDEDLDDLSMNFAQPDFTLVALPTTLRVPRHKSAFRVTHRFLRPVTQGPFGDLAGSLFGLDAGALIGLEFRFGLARGLQLAAHRTSNRTIQVQGQYNVQRQAPDAGFGLDLHLALEGRNNLREAHSPAAGLLLSREIAERMAVYAQPIWVGNTDLGPGEARHTLLAGLGLRARVRPTVYLVAEVTPRLAGFAPGTAQTSLAIEKRVGGHSFQLNVSNGLATTMADLARGGFGTEDWYLGFNISRKFF